MAFMPVSAIFILLLTTLQANFVSVLQENVSDTSSDDMGQLVQREITPIEQERLNELQWNYAGIWWEVAYPGAGNEDGGCTNFPVQGKGSKRRKVRVTYQCKDLPELPPGALGCAGSAPAYTVQGGVWSQEGTTTVFCPSFFNRVDDVVDSTSLLNPIQYVRFVTYVSDNYAWYFANKYYGKLWGWQDAGTPWATQNATEDSDELAAEGSGNCGSASPANFNVTALPLDVENTTDISWPSQCSPIPELDSIDTNFACIYDPPDDPDDTTSTSPSPSPSSAPTSVEISSVTQTSSSPPPTSTACNCNEDGCSTDSPACCENGTCGCTCTAAGCTGAPCCASGTCG
ncbi:uncharacterized protein LY89DRAFT_714791 [Mollisia scopiformis]|uniref:Uncharacterized protein n=1 Tax=Mollisia scopiformis TaxID=149040 RepID=A0A194XNP7_MOLSC|nr:uncharacterized protein LY89DRAFT_714791 [Mollisia scopiformis]KUJ21734.1 hypothetical protein LY89DRAFT_714791 [Mollisia scopiformis]